MKTYEVHTNGGGLQYVDGDYFTAGQTGVFIYRSLVDDDDRAEAVAFFSPDGFLSIQQVEEED